MGGFRPLRVKDQVCFKKSNLKTDIYVNYLSCRAGAWLEIVGIILSPPPIHSINSIRNDSGFHVIC